MRGCVDDDGEIFLFGSTYIKNAPAAFIAKVTTSVALLHPVRELHISAVLFTNRNQTTKK
jgi:hypothetical protein